MKKIFYICLGFSAITCTLMVSCMKDIDLDSTEIVGSEVLSVSEARKFFENRIATLTSRAGDGYLDNGLNPGDFVPCWDEAIVSSSRGLASVDVSIQTSYRYQAIISKFKFGSSGAYHVPVAQKLLVVKDARIGNHGIYILSLIPETEMSPQEARVLINRFVNTGDKGGFSGIAIYSHIQTGKAVRINKYLDGKKITGASLFCSPDRRKANLERMKDLLSGVSLSKKSSIASRWDENDDGSYDGGDLDEVTVTPDDPWPDPYESPWDDPWEPDPDPEPEPDEPQGGDQGNGNNNEPIDHSDMPNKGLDRKQDRAPFIGEQAVVNEKIMEIKVQFPNLFNLIADKFITIIINPTAYAPIRIGDAIILPPNNKYQTWHLREEYFHVAQSKTFETNGLMDVGFRYDAVTGEYLADPGTTNKEFEARLLLDIDRYNVMGGYFGPEITNEADLAKYNDILAEITKNINNPDYTGSIVQPALDNYDFMINVFETVSPQYSGARDNDYGGLSTLENVLKK